MIKEDVVVKVEEREYQLKKVNGYVKECGSMTPRVQSAGTQ